MKKLPTSKLSGRAGARRLVLLRSLTALLAVNLLFGAPGGSQFVAAQANGAELAAARQRLATLYDPLQAMRNDLDRTEFDLGALGLDLAFEDAETIVAHVNSAVRFEPYQGVLRGAEGTLAGGGGNAFDQALLLTTLLFDAGYEAEIWGATLSDQQVELLLQQVRPHAAPAEGQESAAPVFDVQIDLAALESDTEAELAALQADVDRADELLAGAARPSVGSSARIVEASRDYYWVAYRMFEGDPWSQAHPVFTETPPEFTTLEHSQTFSGDIPEEFLHTFTFQVFIERRLGDELRVEPITAAWKRPVANMYGVALTYANVPDGVEADPHMTDPAGLMANTGLFFPMLEGDVAPGGKAFDMLGNVVPPDAAVSPFAPLFQTISGAFADSVGALSGIGFGDDEPEPGEDLISLTAQWFEFTFTAPGQEPVTHRRMVADRLGAEARAAGTLRLNPEVSELDAFTALASVHTLMLDPGRYAQAYVQDRSLEAVIAMRGYVDHALVCALEGVQPDTLPPDLGTLEAAVAPLTLFTAFDDAPLQEGVVSYRPAPAMVLMSQTMDGLSHNVDVVANPRWSVRVSEQGLTFDADANRRAGVWETRMEALPLAAVGQPVVPAFAALGAVEDAGSLRLLDSSVPEAAYELPLPYEARAAIEEDLARGYDVLLPPGHEPASLAEVGWWRVDPVTGETLGRGGDGRGNAFVEYITQSFAVSVSLTAGFTVVGVHQCTKKEDPREAGCCILQNMAMAGVGMGLGFGLGAAYVGAKAALYIFLATDVALNVGGLFMPTFC